MSFSQKIFVASTSFSHNEILRAELLALFPQSTFTYDRQLSEEEFAQLTQNYEGIIVGLDKVNEDFLKNHPSLKMVSKFGVGIDNIDLWACDKKDVKVGWSSGTNRFDVAEHTLGLMIGIARNIFIKHHELKKGLWKKSGGKSLADFKIGIVGLGNVGKELVKMLSPFSPTLLGHDLVYDEEFCRRYKVKKCSKNELLKNADIISLHIPLTSETHYYISDSDFALMQASAWLINTSRGKNVERNALKKALESKTIAGAALDVFEEEPCEDIDLLAFSNLIATPHIAGNSERAVLTMGRASIEHLKNFFEKVDKK